MTANPGILMPSHMTAGTIHHLQDIFVLVLQHIYASTSQSCLQSKFHCLKCIKNLLFPQGQSNLTVKQMQEQACSRLHPLWREVTALNGRTFYFNPFTGRVSQERFEAPPSVQGGILSDEASLLHLCSACRKPQAMLTIPAMPSTELLQSACSQSLTMFATQQHVTLPGYGCDHVVSNVLVSKKVCIACLLSSVTHTSEVKALY